jgi:hypothetical protein
MSNNIGFLYFFLCCGWQLALIVIGWSLHIRYTKRGLLGMLPDFRTYIQKVKEDDTRIFPPRSTLH